jgi:RimJ/RimL family protein N-acetyltransferase
MAASQRRLSAPRWRAHSRYELRLVPLPVDVARQMLAGKPYPETVSRWHPEYPLPDSVDAIAMVFAAHRVVMGAMNEAPAWWIYQIVVDDVVVGDIGFHGPPGPERTVEIGYSVVPAWRRRGVASRACDLILRQAWQDGAEIVVAETDHDNVASQTVLLGNGFHQRSDGIFMIKRPEAR